MVFQVETSYKKWFWAGLVTIVVSAWFSLGYNHPDEHFQVLEFCNYKLGLSSAKELPWEYKTHCRTAIQPFIACCVSKLAMGSGISNPFYIAFLLRLLTGLASWWVTCRMLIRLLPSFSSDQGKKIFVVSSLFLWFVPYLAVRFSAENLSAILFLGALSLILDLPKVSNTKRFINTALAGLLFGFMLFVRVQMAFALLGLGIWLMFIEKLNIRYWLVLCFTGLVAIATCITIDYWFYGEWMLTPYNYFHLNIVQHVAEKWGVFPWWWYITTFIQMAIPPISLALIPFFITGIKRAPFHFFSLSMVLFLLGHFVIGHKEMRFLYPMAFPFIFLVCYGLEPFMEQYAQKRWYSAVFKLLVFMNFAVLFFRLVTPAQEAMKYFAYIYERSSKKETLVFYFNRSPYMLSGVPVNFYRSKNMQVRHLKCRTEFEELLKSNPSRELLYISPQKRLEHRLSGCKLEKLYCIFPDWLLQNNLNDWQDRSNIWTVYKVSAMN